MRHPAALLGMIVALAAFGAGLGATPACAQTEPDEASSQPAQTPAPQGPPIAGAPADSGYYESRIRASAAAAEGLQGPLDGGWTVRGDDGAALYGLQLVDSGGGPLEGAWRDLHRNDPLADHGLLASLERQGDDLSVHFSLQGGNPVVLNVHAFSDDVWSGSLTLGGSEIPVSVTRNSARPSGDYSGARPQPVLLHPYAVRSRHARVHHERTERRGRHGGRGRAERGHGERGHGHASPHAGRHTGSHGQSHGGGSKKKRRR